MTNENNEVVLTVTDVMRRWHCSRQLVLEVIHAGKLAAFRIGTRNYRVRLDEVERYERAAATAAEPQQASGAA